MVGFGCKSDTIHNVYAVFDIGGTHIRFGVAKQLDNLDTTLTLHTPHQFDEGIQLLYDTFAQLSKGQQITAIAGGIAVTLSEEKDRMLGSPNLPGWAGQPLAEKLKEKFHCPILLENDAALGGLGETLYGAGKGQDIVMYLTVGTGVGGSQIVDGKIAPNVHGFEPGHQVIGTQGEEDACGALDHLEAYIGGKYIKLKTGKAPEDIDDPVFWDKITRYLAIGLHNSILHWSPRIVVLSGSVGQHISLEKLTEKLHQQLVIFSQKPRLVRGALGGENGLYGALALLKQKGL